MEFRLRDVTLSDAEALAHVLVTAEQHTFRGLVPDQCLEFTEAQSAANWQKFLSLAELSSLDFMIVAETPNREVIGYVWGGANTDDSGEVRQLSVLPAYHKRGIGRQLVCHVAERLAAAGITRMKVEVLRVNPNRAFYERLGSVFVSERPYNWDGVSLSACVYEWVDTRPLLSHPDIP